MQINGTGNLQDELNRMNPSASHAKLGDLLTEIIADHNALLAKLDADTGVAATDYLSTLRIAPLSER
jgi:hypothetical protein